MKTIYFSGDDMKSLYVWMCIAMISMTLILPTSSEAAVSYDSYRVYGKVKDTDGSPAVSVTVYLTFTGTDGKKYTYSDMTDQYGNYAFLLKGMKVSNGTELTLSVQVGDKIAVEHIKVTDGYPLMEVNLYMDYKNTGGVGDTTTIFTSPLFNNGIIVFTTVAWVVIIAIVIVVGRMEVKRRKLKPKL